MALGLIIGVREEREAPTQGRDARKYDLRVAGAIKNA